MRNNYYEHCARCGGNLGAQGHTLKSSGRALCGPCIRSLPYNGLGHKLDDLVTPAALELEVERKKEVS